MINSYCLLSGFYLIISKQKIQPVISRKIKKLKCFYRWEADVSGTSSATTESDEPNTHISYNVTNFEFLYEPFYVSTDMVPLHDERFLGYGFTRNTQVSLLWITHHFQFTFPSIIIHEKCIWRNGIAYLAFDIIYVSFEYFLQLH